jgi:hypothetical protein
MSRSTEKPGGADPPGGRDREAIQLDPPDHLRCHCGSLLARLVPGGVELKCRRCKRTFTLPLAAGSI